ncbi:MAG: M23 family metallopeptidase [Candidatus Krumholzibacteriia bacterium]
MLIRRKTSLISTFFLLGTGATLGAIVEGGVEPGRPWPLPITINLTSSFAEYRAGHLHAGLDIKTYGREGVRCIAIGNGYVSRLRSSPDGYGKAVYLTLDGGEIAVYAHLSEFSPQLERALYEAQKEENRYRVDVYFDRDRFPVKQGDVLAYTGRTGASAPHLHFEFRDGDQNPVNPLSHGWSLEDKQAPGVRGAVWVPLGAESRIDGACRARDVEVQRVGPDTYAVVDTVRIRGPVGVGAHIVDRLNGTSGRLAPYRVELSVDGVMITSVQMERFSYGHTGEVELAYDMERVRRYNRHYLLLFRREGESLWNREFRGGGVIDPARLENGGARAHTAVVRAIDRAGNVSVTMIPFVSDDGGPGAPGSTAGDGGPDGCYFFGDLMSVEKTALVPERGAARASSRDRLQLAFRVDDLPGGTMQLTPAGTGRVFHVFAVHGGESIVGDVASLGAGVSTNERSLYASAFLYLSAWPHEAAPSAELQSIVSPVEVGPTSLVFKRSAGLRMALDGKADGREAVYRLDERKKEWSYNQSRVRGDTVYTSIRSPGVYGVFVDAEAPRIAELSLAKRKSYATGEALPEIVIALVDEGSGIDPDLSEVRLNGERQVARWDGFAKKMFVLLREPVPEGAYEVSVVAVDRAGNRAIRQSRIELSSHSGGIGEETEDNAQ